MKDGYLPDYDGLPVKATCEVCTYLTDDSDGPEYGPSWMVCTHSSKSHMSNLKGFPFKTSQKCCVLPYAFTINWSEVHRDEVYAQYGKII